MWFIVLHYLFLVSGTRYFSTTAQNNQQPGDNRQDGRQQNGDQDQDPNRDQQSKWFALI